ncbi:uncharacterized protein [Nicotiana sylvestris]
MMLAEMVRTRAIGQDERPPIPPVARTAARAVPADPPTAPVHDQVIVVDAPAGPAQAQAEPIVIPDSGRLEADSRGKGIAEYGFNRFKIQGLLDMLATFDFIRCRSVELAR